MLIFQFDVFVKVHAQRPSSRAAHTFFEAAFGLTLELLAPDSDATANTN